MADWEEIKRLAADFQRAQLSSTSQRLSDRNCVELVQRLVELKLIDVIYTNDGKEYLTPEELGKEIREELLVHGGRINLVELQRIINVDLSLIQSKANEIVAGDRNLYLVLGQLIDGSYLNNIADDINDKLQEAGQVTFVDLTKQYDLPPDFLNETLGKRVGTIIKGKIDELDRGVIYTEAFVSRHRAKIRGAFSAITRPTPIQPILVQLGLLERLLFNVLDELVASGWLAGSITGGRQEKAVYVPASYTRAQSQWVESFFTQNGYLEYDALSRLGITDPKGYIKRHIKGAKVLYLSTCCVGQAKLDQIEAEVDEALATGSWLDIKMSLPSMFSDSDANQILQKCLASKSSWQIFCETIVASEKFVQDCAKPFDELMAAKADKDAKSNAQFLMSAKASGIDDSSNARDEKREQRRKKATTGSKGGGTQGREVKMKSTKKKYKVRGGGGGDDDSDEDVGGPSARGRGHRLDFMTEDEIEEELHKMEALNECPDDFRTELAQQLHRPLQNQYQEVAKSVFLQSVGTVTNTARKKTHGELQEKINGLWTNIHLFEKGIKFFTEDTSIHLTKHLLKTVCSDVANLIFNEVARLNLISVSDDIQMTMEVRLKMLSKIPDDNSKQILTKIHSSLNSKALEDFYQQVEQACGTGQLEIMLKKPDKKKERQAVFSHRQAIAEQLRSENEPAMALHLAVTLLFHVHTQTMVHAPGRCVPALITFLTPYVGKESHDVLKHCQDLVMKQLRYGEQSMEDSCEKDEIQKELTDLLPKVKEIALTARRSQGHVSED